MKKDEPMRNINPFGLRLQPDLKARLETAAAENKRSLNAEISARLEESFEHLRPPPNDSVGQMKRMLDAQQKLNESLEKVLGQLAERPTKKRD